MNNLQSEFLYTITEEKLDPRCLTCYDCPNYETCDYADDLYNTDGDCLDEK